MALHCVTLDKAKNFQGNCRDLLVSWSAKQLRTKPAGCRSLLSFPRNFTDAALRLAILLIVSAFVVQCGGRPDQMFGGLPDGASIHRDEPFRVAWRKELYRPSELSYLPEELAIPALLPQKRRLIIGGADGYVRNVDIQTGQLYWEVDTQNRVTARPIVDGDRVWVGSYSGYMMALDTNSGRQLWKYDSSAAILSEATLLDGRLFYTTDTNAVYALDAQTGKYLWHKSRPHTQEFTILGQAPVVGADGVIYAGFSDGVLMAMAPEDGASVWSRQLGDGTGRFGDIDFAPVIDGDVLYVTSFRGGVYAIDRTTNEILWRHEVEGGRGPILSGSRLYLGTAGKEVRCIRAADGGLLWKTSLPDGVPSVPTLVGRWVVVGASGYLALLRADSGEVSAIIPTVDGFSAHPVALGNRLFVAANGGNLFALDLTP
ncbi:MAG: PQQ-binding-like beta-propeller repeat protein [Myxococcales bacterium]|nr:PQQ-binding-like beta-propeller repeat protein [Myxococcales bacterium]